MSINLTQNFLMMMIVLVLDEVVATTQGLL